MIGFRSITRRRYSAAEVRGSDGRASTPASADVVISAVLQRPTAAQLQRLPEGQRVADSWYVDTAAELRTRDELGGVPADLLVVDGVLYRVLEVADESRSPIPHYEGLAARLPEGRTA